MVLVVRTKMAGDWRVFLIYDNEYDKQYGIKVELMKMSGLTTKIVGEGSVGLTLTRLAGSDKETAIKIYDSIKNNEDVLFNFIDRRGTIPSMRYIDTNSKYMR